MNCPTIYKSGSKKNSIDFTTVFIDQRLFYRECRTAIFRLTIEQLQLIVFGYCRSVAHRLAVV